MKGYMPFLIILLLLAVPFTAYAAVPGFDEITAGAAVLMDFESGQTLYEKNASQQRPPASITKIMTALLTLEYLRPEQVLIAGEEAVNLPTWGSSAYIKAGEKLTVRDAMYALMLRSANEAANILAEEIAGSQSNFADMMNERALASGASNTRFLNAHGLTSRRQRGHLTTARDIALITREALKTPGFISYFGATSYIMNPTNLSEERVFTNTHRMLLEDYAQYDAEVIGGKTGYTGPSGYTLVTVAERGGRTLICVLLKSENMYADTRKLLDFGFDEFMLYTYTISNQAKPIGVPIYNGELETGRAMLSYPDSAELLLHESADPGDITEAYVYDRNPKPGDEITGRVELRIKSGRQSGLPALLSSVPMNVAAMEYSPRSAEAYSAPEEPVPALAPEKAMNPVNKMELVPWIITITVLGIPVVLACFILFRDHD